jgi:hypothetical protein
MLSRFSKPKLVVHQVSSGKNFTVGTFPAYVGGTGAQVEVEQGDRALLEIKESGKELRIESLGRPMIAGGAEMTDVALGAEQQLMIAVGGHLLLVAWTQRPSELLKEWCRDAWRIVDQGSNLVEGPFPYAALPEVAPRVHAEQPDAILHQAACPSGFHLRTVMEVMW